MRTSGTVTKKLAESLHERGHVAADAADVAAEGGADAVRDLPRAERLSRLLYKLAERGPTVDRSRSATMTGSRIT